MSLFEELIQETPKNSKHHLFKIKNYEDPQKTPLKEIMFSSAGNVDQLKTNLNNRISQNERSENERMKKSNIKNELIQNCVSKYLEDRLEPNEKEYNEKIK